MAPNYPELPDSPVPVAMNKKTISKKDANKKYKAPPSPLSTSSEYVEDDFSKYRVVRDAIGTGIFSSLFTISLLIFINEVRFFLYYRDYLSLNPFSNFLFSSGFIISILQLITITCVLFVPSYLLQGNKMAKLSPLALAIVIQLFMLHFHDSDSSVKIFTIQGWYGKYLMVKDFLMSYGAFFGSCFIFYGLTASYNTYFNKIFRTFKYVNHPDDDDYDEGAV